jgi:hypothetical protein
MEVHMDLKSHTRTGLAEKVFKLALVVIPLLTEIIHLISKVVNYAGPVPKFRVQARP